MDVLQSTVSMLAGFDEELPQDTEDHYRVSAIKIIAKIPTIIATWDRIRKKKYRNKEN